MDPKITTILEAAIRNKVFPGCSIVVMQNREVTYGAYGHFTYDTTSPMVTVDTVYDTASLTKIVGPMTLAQMLIAEGKLRLDDRVGTYIPEFVSEPQKASVTIAHLLTYTLDYNIPDGSKSLLGTRTAREIANTAITYPLKHAPGTNYMYSNITAFVLTQLIERIAGQKFYDLVNERVLLPLGMNTATFHPDADQISAIPPTEITAERGLVQGFVHDEFTYYTTQGGVSNGAAGLFASVQDLAPFLEMTLGRGSYHGQTLVSHDLVARWTEDYFPSLLPIHTPLAWGDQNNIYLDHYHRNIVLKSGFTGCFMVGDLTTQRGFVLLANRTYPTRPTDKVAFGSIKESLLTTIL